MGPPRRNPRVLVAGAGPVGALLPLVLGPHGFEVHVVDPRDDPRVHPVPGHRNTNIQLSTRGRRILDAVGVWDHLARKGAFLMGRQFHLATGSRPFTSYGQGRALLSLHRSILVHHLADTIEARGARKIEWNTELVDATLTPAGKGGGGTATLRGADGAERSVAFDFLVGADGIRSRVRELMQAWSTTRPTAAGGGGEDGGSGDGGGGGSGGDAEAPITVRTTTCSWGWKTLTIPAAMATSMAGKALLNRDGIHYMPRKTAMFVVVHNHDGSWNAVLFLPLQHKTEGNLFEALDTDDKVLSFMTQHFPQMVALMPTLLKDWSARPWSTVSAVDVSRFSFRDTAVLLGDAAHAMFPFHGQGVNSAYEDVAMLHDALAAAHATAAAAAAGASPAEAGAEAEALLRGFIRTFTARRKADVDAIAASSAAMIVDKPVPLMIWQAIRDSYMLKLHNRWPAVFVPNPSVHVTFSSRPYGEVIAQSHRQQRAFNAVGLAVLVAVLYLVFATVRAILF